VEQWFNWYNQVRPHQRLNYGTPNQVYYDSLKENDVS
jgi:putative transposase